MEKTWFLSIKTREISNLRFLPFHRSLVAPHRATGSGCCRKRPDQCLASSAGKCCGKKQQRHEHLCLFACLVHKFTNTVCKCWTKNESEMKTHENAQMFKWKVSVHHHVKKQPGKITKKLHQPNIINSYIQQKYIHKPAQCFTKSGISAMVPSQRLVSKLQLSAAEVVIIPLQRRRANILGMGYSWDMEKLAWENEWKMMIGRIGIFCFQMFCI